MKQLWAPWRMSFIDDTKEGKPSCIFCHLPQDVNDKKNLILYRGELAFVIMNKYPYNSGHLMVAPYVHAASLSKLDDDSLIELSSLTKVSVAIIEKLFKPDGLNVGMNIGRAGGAGFDKHIHTHIVPRWNGDFNFMPLLAETKVIPEHLEATYEKMLPLFKGIEPL